MNCLYTTAGSMDFLNIITCTLVSLGIPFEYFALGVLVLFILISAISRLDFDFSLAGAITLTWALMVMAGSMGASVYMLQYIMGLLILGFGLRLLIGFVGVFRQ